MARLSMGGKGKPRVKQVPDVGHRLGTPAAGQTEEGVEGELSQGDGKGSHVVKGLCLAGRHTTACIRYQVPFQMIQGQW